MGILQVSYFSRISIRSQSSRQCRIQGASIAYMLRGVDAAKISIHDVAVPREREDLGNA